jgi:hypothetical protein
MTHEQALRRGYKILMEDGTDHAKPGKSMWHTVASDAAAGREPVDQRRADLR